jgi:hypothetical protein
VLRKNATKPEKRVVETGLEAEGEVEIVAGVLEGETVTSRP